MTSLDDAPRPRATGSGVKINLTKAMLDSVIRRYNIRQGRPTEQARKRIAIIISEYLIETGLDARSGAILERCLYDYLQNADLDCNETPYELYLKDVKHSFMVDPLKIGLPEGIEYAGDTIYKTTQIIQYLKENANGEGTKKDNTRGNTIRSFKYKKTDVGYTKTKRSSLYQGNEPEQILL